MMTELYTHDTPGIAIGSNGSRYVQCECVNPSNFEAPDQFIHAIL